MNQIPLNVDCRKRSRYEIFTKTLVKRTDVKTHQRNVNKIVEIVTKL